MNAAALIDRPSITVTLSTSGASKAEELRIFEHALVVGNDGLHLIERGAPSRSSANWRTPPSMRPPPVVIVCHQWNLSQMRREDHDEDVAFASWKLSNIHLKPDGRARTHTTRPDSGPDVAERGCHTTPWVTLPDYPATRGGRSTEIAGQLCRSRCSSARRQRTPKRWAMAGFREATIKVMLSQHERELRVYSSRW